MSDCESRIWDTGDAPLGLRKPGGLPVYGLPVVATLFMLRMLWVTRRDAGLRVKMCVWLGVSRGLDLAFLNAD